MDNVTRLLMQGAAGAAGGGTYVDDVFSTYLWFGNETARTIPTGVDNTEGALAWVKSRNDTHQHHLVDTERGSNKVIYSDSHVAESTIANRITGFTNNGFNLGSAGQVNGTSAYKYAGWNFRKAKGFFDIVTWTGNATNSSSPPRQIAHNLGSVPGAIWVKCLTANQSWACYHKSLGATRYMHLSDPGSGGTSVAWWNNTEPTSTHFTVGYDGQVNENNQQYVAYVFAGGASTAANARSVYFNGGASLSLADTTDLEPGSGDFTIEAWVKPNADATSYDYLWSNGWGQQISWYNSGSGEMKFRAWFNDAEDSNYNVSLTSRGACAPREVWNHVAVVRNGNTWTLYVNGNAESTVTASFTVSANSDLPTIGRFDGSGSNSYHLKGSVSNFRFTKGQALYTSNFKPSIEPLTTTSQGAQAGNVKLLCCNGSTPTSSTVTPGTITNNSGSTTRINNPFDDPKGYKFGEEGDQNIIKCGSYAGNGATDPYAPIIDLGWEPQWVLIKASDRAAEWSIVDCTRGIVTGGNDAALYPSEPDAEVTSYDIMDVNATGFQLKTSNQLWNQDTKHYIYIAIRRPDGAVGKPAEAGTDTFAMAYGSTTNPSINGGIPIDFAFVRQPATTEDWYTGSRLTGANKVFLNKHDAMTSQGNFVWDYMDGWQNSSNSNYLSWMWKRNAGFDVVNYVGNLTAGHQISHSLNKVPEMIWLRSRTITGRDWVVYHKGCNGGVNPWLYRLRLDHTDGERSASSFFGAAPTTTNFTVGASADSNGNGDSIIAFLFSSVDGISKVGYYDGSDSAQTITIGFQPRYVIIKNATTDGDGWITFDTTRGWGSGNDPYLFLNSTAAENSIGTYDWGAPTSTGFTVTSVNTIYNSAGKKFVYYAHA